MMFKRVLAENLDPERLTTVFGVIYTALNFVSLVIQLLVTPRLLGLWGVRGALVVLPLLMLASATGFALSGAVFAIVLLKLADGGLRHSLQRAGSEILFLPLPARVRDQAKPAADAISMRGGQALAAILTFALASFGFGTQMLGAIVAGFASAWILGPLVVGPAYNGPFRDMPQGRHIPAPSAIRASARLVTEHSRTMPAPLSASMAGCDGKPKWKLTTAGFSSSSICSMSGSSTNEV